MDREVTLCDLLQHLLLLSRLPWLQPSGRGILKLLRKHEGMASAPQPDGPEPTPVILGEEAHPAKDGFLYSLEAPPSGGRQAKVWASPTVRGAAARPVCRQPAARHCRLLEHLEKALGIALRQQFVQHDI